MILHWHRSFQMKDTLSRDRTGINCICIVNVSKNSSEIHLAPITQGKLDKDERKEKKKKILTGNKDELRLEATRLLMIPEQHRNRKKEKTDVQNLTEFKKKKRNVKFLWQNSSNQK